MKIEAMRPFLLELALAALLVAAPLATPVAQENKGTAPPADSVTRQRYKIAGAEAAFTVTAGTLPLNDAKGERQANVFYTAYVRDGAPRDKRPISFVFNGSSGRSVLCSTAGRAPAPPISTSAR